MTDNAKNTIRSGEETLSSKVSDNSNSISDMLKDELGLPITFSNEGVFFEFSSDLSKKSLLNYLKKIFEEGFFIEGIDENFESILDIIVNKNVSEDSIKLGKSFKKFDLEEKQSYQKRLKEKSGKILFNFGKIVKDGGMKRKDIESPIEKDKLFSILLEYGVVFGLDFEKIDKSVQEIEEQVQTGKNNQFVDIIAEGIQPKNGEDAYFEHLIDIEKDFSPLDREDGKVDMKRAKNPIPQITDLSDPRLIRKVPPTIGYPGMTVFGTELRQVHGKDHNLRRFSGKGTNIEVVDGVEYLVAKTAGFISKDSKGKISITSECINNTNIGPKTGILQIDAENFHQFGTVENGYGIEGKNIVLKGGKLNGFLKSNGGKIILFEDSVGGDIENIGGSLMVKGKLINSEVRCVYGKTKVEYAENSIIIGTDVEVRKAVNCIIIGDNISIGSSYGNNIHCSGSLHMDNNGMLSGGNMTEGLTTNIMLSVDKVRLMSQEELNSMQLELEEINREISEINADLEKIKSSKEVQNAISFFEKYKKGEVNLRDLPHSKRQLILGLFKKLQTSVFDKQKKLSNLKNRREEINKKIEDAENRVKSDGYINIKNNSSDINFIYYLLGNYTSGRVGLDNYGSYLNAVRRGTPYFPKKISKTLSSSFRYEIKNLREELETLVIEDKEDFGTERQYHRVEFLYRGGKELSLENRIGYIKDALSNIEQIRDKKFIDVSSLDGVEVEKVPLGYSLLMPVGINGNWKGVILDLSSAGIGFGLEKKEGVDSDIIENDLVRLDLNILGEELLVDVYVRRIVEKNGHIIVGGNFYYPNPETSRKINEIKTKLEGKINQINRSHDKKRLETKSTTRERRKPRK
ncbi:flagellar assembly protein A [Candidatus Absconditicoccus praedator]|uniref:flagellar assembly protein A n=1 Tax=Candidatus Absconditicoccus praedator TaxID=2735562 RepID=UPI001E4EDD25|nr:flagellar assembly protein A [Candidatus Absconditicoccus praedator]UFX83037.1 DUF342 domain-containing protein [Candidatus Absconditicoccus praedator]